MPDKIPEMVDYYMARTSHGSTLSGVVHTWVLARANRDRAMEFFQQALKSDVSDIQGGTTSEGIHLAAMAGSVDLMQRCFTGLETRPDRIIFSPHWPEALGVLAFPIHYRGLHLHLRVSGKGVIISVGSARRRRSRSGMPWPRRSADARDHCSISRLTRGRSFGRHQQLADPQCVGVIGCVGPPRHRQRIAVSAITDLPHRSSRCAAGRRRSRRRRSRGSGVAGKTDGWTTRG